MVHVPFSSAANPTATSPLTQITSGPATEHVELRLRQNAGPTCGYLSGDTASPLTCGSGFSCTRGVYSEFGCCNKVECDSNYAMGCIDASNQQCEIEGYNFDCKYLSSVLTCSDSCITYLLKAPGAFTTATYRSYACGAKGSTRIALSTATNGAGGGGGGDSGGGGGLVDFPTFPGAGGVPTTTALSGGDSSNSNGNGGSSSNNNNNSPFNSDGGGGIGAGAIAGIAVGSAVGALLVALLIWFLVRQKGKKAPPPNYSQTVVSGWLDQTH